MLRRGMPGAAEKVWGQRSASKWASASGAIGQRGVRSKLASTGAAQRVLWQLRDNCNPGARGSLLARDDGPEPYTFNLCNLRGRCL